MTARQHIKEYLSKQDGYVPSGEIHDHVCQFGLKRISSHSALLRMAARGEIIRKGRHKHTQCRLRTDLDTAGRVKSIDELLRGVRA